MSRNNFSQIQEMPAGFYKGIYGSQDDKPVERFFEVVETELDIKMIIEDCGEVAILSDRTPVAYMESLPGMEDMLPQTIEKMLQDGGSDVIRFKSKER